MHGMPFSIHLRTEAYQVAGRLLRRFRKNSSITSIKEVYEKYHDRGFDVIGISFDEDEAVLRKFITEKELPWRQILDSRGFKGVFAKQYGVHGIPAPFLIDRNGKVISVNARDSILDELVEAEIEGKKD